MNSSLSTDQVLPTKHLPPLLRELRAPMGFKDALNPPTVGDVLKRVKELNVPDRGGFVAYHDLLQAFARTSIGEAEMPPADTEIGKTLREVKASALSDAVYEKVKETKVGGTEVSAEKIAAATTVQTAFRRRKKEKQFRIAAEKLAKAEAAKRRREAKERAAANKAAGGGRSAPSKR